MMPGRPKGGRTEHDVKPTIWCGLALATIGWSTAGDAAALELDPPRLAAAAQALPGHRLSPSATPQDRTQRASVKNVLRWKRLRLTMSTDVALPGGTLSEAPSGALPPLRLALR